tara:strand:- start:55 stop:951 length:897 start_codon:yes stop_codon:yes gene_type:complete
MARKKVEKSNVVTPVASAPVEETTQTVEAPKVSNPLPSFGNKVSRKPSVYKLIRSYKDKNGNDRYPIVYMLKSEDVVFDAQTGTQRAIRYVRGQKSIFVDEQNDDVVAKSPITFNNGFHIVEHTNPNLKKFLDMCNANRDNPDRLKTSTPSFALENSEKKAKENLEKSRNMLNAATTALTMSIDKLVGYAKVLGVNVDKSTDEIRYDMKILAEKDPVGFIAGLDSPLTDMKGLILKAKEYKILSLQSNKVMWNIGDKQTLIVNVPMGIQPIDHLAELCLTVDGEPIVAQIKAQLSRYN